MKLINGDCLEIMKDLSDNSIDFLFGDLPYGQTSCKWDCIIDLDLFWEQVNRICKSDACMAFTCSVKFGNTLINSNPKNFRRDLVWVKSSACGFLNAKKMEMKKHEMIYIFYRKLPKVYTENIALYHTHKFLKPNPDGYTGKCYGGKKESIKTKYNPSLPVSVMKEDNIVETVFDSNSLYGKESKKIRYKNEDGSINKSLNQTRYEPSLPNTILEIKSEKGKHATQKPIPLMEYLIKYYSREGEVVLDPTMGSGSTGIACKNLNRKFIGIEKDEDIFKIALERNNE